MSNLSRRNSTVRSRIVAGISSVNILLWISHKAQGTAKRNSLAYKGVIDPRSWPLILGLTFVSPDLPYGSVLRIVGSQRALVGQTVVLPGQSLYT